MAHNTKVCNLSTCGHIAQGSRVLGLSSSVSICSWYDLRQVTRHFQVSVFCVISQSTNPLGCLVCSKPQKYMGVWCWPWEPLLQQGAEPILSPLVHMGRLPVLCPKCSGNTQVNTLPCTLPRDMAGVWRNNSICL